jgi:2,4-dienoyl-CoA reductase (NADPH2)
VVNIIEGIKARLGDDFTIILTINGIENNMGDKGITEEETLELVKLYEDAGADAFQPRVYELYNRASYWSEQYFYPEKRSETPAGLDFSHRGIGAFTKIGASLKQVTTRPIVIPGKWDSDFAFAEEMLELNKVDVIAVCRGLFADTDLPIKMKEGRFEEIAPCTACLSCLTGGMLPIRCRINAFIGGKEEYNKYLEIKEKKKVLVIGAGPAGLEAARVSALRGHDVVLYSKEGFVGGLMNMASVIKGDYPEDIQQIVEYYSVQLKKLKVKIVKGKEADLKTIEKEEPDVVFLATGASVGEREIPGSDNKIVVSDTFLRAGLDLALKVTDPSKLSKATQHWMPLGKNVIVMGGDVKGVQLAEFLTKRDRKVTLVCEEDDMQYGEGLPRLNNFKLGEWFKEKGVEIIKNVRFEKITETGLVLTTREGAKVTLPADSIVPVYPLKTNEELYQNLQGKVPEVYAIGACKDPKALIVDAVEDAAKMASSI